MKNRLGLAEAVKLFNCYLVKAFYELVIELEEDGKTTLMENYFVGCSES